MNLRIALILLTSFLSLSISADRTWKNCPGGWSRSSHSEPVESGMGVNIHFTDPKPGEIKLIAGAGLRWVRMDFKWGLTERVRDQYDFSSYDRLMSELDHSRIRALLILDYGNPLYDGDGPPRTAQAREAFTRWAVAAAKHFQGRGVVWEIYNEPNNSVFWPPKPNAAEYIALALAVGRAFRAEAPNEKLIGPATSGIDLTFLEACFQAGLLEYWSAVSVHPYRRSDPEEAANDYCRLRELIDRYRTGAGAASQREIPIIAGEWGYSSVWRNMDEDRQGILLAREMLTNLANGIPISIWYDWRDDGTDPGEAEHHFGMVRNAHTPGRNPIYDPKPAYLAARTVCQFLSGYAFDKRLVIGSKDDYVLVFIKGGERRLTAWTTLSAKHQVVIPLGAGSFTVTKHNGESGGTITTAGPGVSIEISTAPVYLARVN